MKNKKKSITTINGHCIHVLYFSDYKTLVSKQSAELGHYLASKYKIISKSKPKKK